jgi:selenide,water dikinase
VEIFGEGFPFEDAFLWEQDKSRLLLTVDFFTPIVDSPYDFGCIAVANSLSDIYAKGGEPKVALNLLMYPFSKLGKEVLVEILKGADSKLEEANTLLGGGHSIDDDNIKLGYAVIGIAGEKVWKINTAKEGDEIFITKPLGTGIISQGIKLKSIDQQKCWEAIESMKKLNKYAKDILTEFPVSACTDVTGYGLLGHLTNMLINTDLSATIYLDEVPFFENVEILAKQNIAPGGTKKNLAYFENNVEWQKEYPQYLKLMLADAQTSGGLLFTIEPSYKHQLLKKFKENKHFIKAIGKITKRANKLIKI